jgi:hypothetical protein
MQALEMGAKVTADVVVALRTGVGTTAGEVLARKTNQNDVDTKLTQANAEIDKVKQSAVTTSGRTEKVETVLNALQQSFKDMVEATQAAWGLAKVG